MFICLLACALSSVVWGQPQKGVLLYCGLTDYGWQVFQYDFALKAERQLTFTPGDKRSPVYVFSRHEVFFKDANGQLRGVSLAEGSNKEAETKTKILSHDCSHFAIGKKYIYYTRLATGNPQRQFIWRQSLSEPVSSSELFFRPSKGSIRQLSIAPDSDFIVAAHITEIDEERLVQVAIADSNDFDMITPRNTISVYPVYAPDEDSIYYARQVGENNFDLWQVSLMTGKHTALLKTEDTSEFSCSVDAEQRYLFFEQRSAEGIAIAFLELASSKKQMVSLPHAAREPKYYDYVNTTEKI